MSEIVKTEAVVLKSMKYRETSKIVTLYTRDFGKISAIVKGARDRKNRYGSSLEPMSYVHVVLYKKEGRELQTLTQCDIVRSFRALSENLESMSVGLSIIELIHVVAHEEESNILLFNLLITTLTALNTAGNNPIVFLYYFEIHLARILGFQATFDRCISCSRPVSRQLAPGDEILFHDDRGGPLCNNCVKVGGQTSLLSRRSLILLQEIASTDNPADLHNRAITNESRVEIGNFLWGYLRYHVSGIRTLRSAKVFSKILTMQ